MKCALLSAEPGALSTRGQRGWRRPQLLPTGCVSLVPADLGQREMSPSAVWSSRKLCSAMEGSERGKGMFREADNPASWHCLKTSKTYVLPELPHAS